MVDDGLVSRGLMMRALVLGATGHLGAHIVRALLAAGHEVRAAYRSERFLEVLDGLPVERVRVDLERFEGVPEALAGCAWVFHAAAYYPALQQRRLDALPAHLAAMRRVLEALAAARPARFVFTSSAATIRALPDRPVTEEDAESWPPRRPRSVYATVKIAEEHEVLRAAQQGLPVVIVNPSICIGEYDAHRFSGHLVLLFAKHRLPVYLDCALNVVYTGDVGVGHLRAAERGRIGERYLLTGHNVGLGEFAAAVARVAGVPPPRWRVSYGTAMAAATACEAVAWLRRGAPWLPREIVLRARAIQRLDGTKALRELGLPQTPLEEALRRAMTWFRRHGDLT